MIRSVRLNQLTARLYKYGEVQICSKGTVLTVLITGVKMDSVEKVFGGIVKTILEHKDSKDFSVVECMRNDETFFCAVFRKPEEN